MLDECLLYEMHAKNDNQTNRNPIPKHTNKMIYEKKHNSKNIHIR